MVLLGHLLWIAGLACAHPARRASATRRFPETVSTYTSVDSVAGDAKNLRRDEPLDYVQIATRKLEETINETYRLVDDFYVGSNGIGHVRFRQTVDGVDLENADFNVNVMSDGTILSFGNSFVDSEATSRRARRANLLSPEDAFRRAVGHFGIAAIGTSDFTIEPASADKTVAIKGAVGFETDPLVKKVMVQSDKGLVQAWRVELNTSNDWVLVYIDASSGEQIGLVDYTNHATYEAYPWGALNPNEALRSLIANPEDPAASPLGWHRDTQSYTLLRGNNAYVTIGWQTSPNNTGPNSASLIFSYPYSPATTDSRSNVDAAATQAFYTVNKLHDILYSLGFDEVAGNFQNSNQGKGGRESDAVNIIIQDSSAVASMSVPADGVRPVLRLGVLSRGGDFALDGTVVIHEYMHGVTGRLVGGPTNSQCLGWNMDGLSITEAISDFVPTVLRVKSGDTRATEYSVADWATGTALGLRDHFISTNMQRTPLTFTTLNDLASMGGTDLGTLWTSVLYEVFWNMADVYGVGEVGKIEFGADGLPKGARFLSIKLLLDSLALMPCSPQHLNARDALLDADRVATGGANKCAIWKAMAKRGFGVDAVRGTGLRTRVNGFTVPADC